MMIVRRVITLSGAVTRMMIGAGAVALLVCGVKQKRGRSKRREAHQRLITRQGTERIEDLS